MAKSTDMKVERRADVGNMFIEIEMAVKSDANYKELDLCVSLTSIGLLEGHVPATSMEVSLLSDLSRGLVPKQIASVLVGFRTRSL